MATSHVDVAVIGAGPGGGAAATVLARAGLSVALIEREALPRWKPCGGMIGGRDLAALAGLMPAVPRIRPAEFRYRYRGERAAAEPIPPDGCAVVERSAFDKALADHAVASGRVDLHQGVRVTAVRPAGERVLVECADPGRAFDAAFVIGADGPAGITARSVGLRRAERAAVSLDVDLDGTPDIDGDGVVRAVFDMGAPGDGYGWLFPSPQGLACGVASFAPVPPRALADGLERLLARHLPGPRPERRRRGYPIPHFEPAAPRASGRVCLVGDAAGLADGIWGAGIGVAMRSGILAAEAILACRDRPEALAAAYTDALEQEILPRLRVTRQLAAFRRRFPRDWYRAAIERGQRSGAILQLMAMPQIRAVLGPDAGPIADPLPPSPYL